ncbi:TPA: DUF362 domain-containing protein [Candidatus Bathyarchaeota archaeon]|nr:DUF362 domain-containing protein [Candidatus Bathyarchaeota archaeon]
MDLPKVYFVDVHARNSKESLLNKLESLFNHLEVAKAVAGRRVAIKTHVGAPLCTRYIRPVFIRKIVDLVRESGGEPFVTDTTTLDIYRTRGTARGHLEVATSHGFTEETLNAPIIVADGSYGFDCVAVKVNGLRLREVYVAKEFAESDVILSVAHFKGHALSGIGGACKNLGIGGCGKLSKNAAHFESLPRVDEEKCNGCGACLSSCLVQAISIVEGKAQIDESKCFACRACIEDCPEKAIGNQRSSKEEFNLKMADLVYGLIKLMGKDNLFCFNFLLEVDWLCDCEHNQLGWSDLPIVPDIGITASRDPVAIDQTSVDLVNKAPGTPGSKAEEARVLKPGGDKFQAINGISPSLHLEALERLGVGSRRYKLIKV